MNGPLDLPVDVRNQGDKADSGPFVLGANEPARPREGRVKRLGLLLGLVCVNALAATTVTGKIQNLGTGNVTHGAFVRFWLRGCGGNQPRVNGTSVISPTQGGVFFFDFPADASGNISGTLYSTRDATGNGNGEIECGGSLTAVWYAMQVFYAGNGGPEVQIHAKIGATLNISNVAPITTNPVVAAPAGDGTYSRLDTGNTPFTGNVQAPGLNSVINPFLYAGSDIGAQVNAAAASCVAGQQCHIVIPVNSQLSFSTSIVFVANETLECTRQGIIDNTAGSDATAILKYTGTGTAITMGSISGRFIGCDLLLPSGSAGGIRVGGTSVTAYSNHVEDASIRGGGTGTVLYHVSCPGVSGFCEDNHIIHTRLSDFIGVGIATDFSNDTYIIGVTEYAKASNATSTHVIVDSSSGGVIIDNLIGGSVGAHGFVERRTLGGNFPSFIFANDMEMDGTSNSSECWLFDATLASANVDATFVDSWAAGCTTGPGIHISGGSGIHIGGGSRIRSNGKDGILIDVTSNNAEYGTIIADSYIQGNSQSAATFNGISITGHPGNIVIANNHINNFPEVGGQQQYALGVTGDVEGIVFSNNDCSHNAVGCFNVPSVVGRKMTLSGNVSPDLGTAPFTQFPGDMVSVGNIVAGGGSNTLFRCVTAGATLPIGSLTINASACGSTADTGLRVK
jgi:hypothetical protein